MHNPAISFSSPREIDYYRQRCGMSAVMIDLAWKLRRDNSVAKYEYLAAITQVSRGKLKLAESFSPPCCSIFAWFTSGEPKLSNARTADAKRLRRKTKEKQGRRDKSRFAGGGKCNCANWTFPLALPYPL